MSNKKKLQESTYGNDNPNVKINKKDYEQLPNKDALSSALGNKGEITLTTNDKMNESSSGNLEQQAFFAGLIQGNNTQKGAFVGDMNKNRFALMAWEKFKSSQLPEIPDEERYERSQEYGLRGESFDKLMEDLKKSGAPKININEKINPRIKKSDLIDYIKNKK